MASTLESYRSDLPVGRVAYIYGDLPHRPFLCHEAAINAFYITVDALTRFQTSDAIGSNTYVIPAIGLWFLATESYISTIYKVTQADYERHGSSAGRPKPRVTQKLVEKYKSIEDYFAAPTPRPRAPISALGEFTALRNTLFHDLTNVKQPEFHHTLFPSHVENVNEVDLLQGMIIAIDLFTYFRTLFPKADLMPSIPVGLAFEKLDTLVGEVIFPAFEEILQAKGLTTFLKLHMGSQRIAATAPLPLYIIMRHEGAQVPTSSSIAERISDRYLREAVGRRPVEDGLFQLPNYAR
jgi:hypothetical protein